MYPFLLNWTIYSIVPDACAFFCVALTPAVLLHPCLLCASLLVLVWVLVMLLFMHLYVLGNDLGRDTTAEPATGNQLLAYASGAFRVWLCDIKTELPTLGADTSGAYTGV